MVDKSVRMAQGLYLTCNLIYFKLCLRLLRVLKKTQSGYELEEEIEMW